MKTFEMKTEMKTLIVYDSKHGATKKICNWIKEGIGEADVRKADEVSRLDYEIMVGSPIYFNKPLKSVINFLENKKNELKNKRPFVVCIRNGEKYLEKIKKFVPTIEDGKIFKRSPFHLLNKGDALILGGK
jgi:menaquinone-dependent protoporphyrinogen oxidase